MNDAATSDGRKRHIAFVLQGLGAGGSERIVSLLCNHFCQKGWTVTLFAFEDSATPPYYPLDPRVRLRPLGYKPQKMGRLEGIKAVWKRIRLLRKGLKAAPPDLIISFLTRTNIYAVLASRSIGCPIVVSERNNPSAQRVDPVWNWLRQRTYRIAAGLVTMTNGAMEFFPPEMRRHSWVVPNPVTIDPAKPLPARNGKVITAVGRLVPQKGFDLLLPAFAKLAEEHADWQLVIWGEGPERAKLEDQCNRLGIADHTSLPGVSETPGGWVRESDVFVLSSRFEGWGLVLSEAMASGLPVVSFDCQWGPAEMIEHETSGLLVPEGDVDALAQALSRMCGDKEWRLQQGDNARESMQRFSPDRILAIWEQVVEEALETAK